MVIFAFINIAFYCHDRAALTFIGQSACLIGVYEDEKEAVTERITEVLYEKSQEELLGTWSIEEEVTVLNDRVVLVIHAKSLLWTVEVNTGARLQNET